jgi:hypothetical protein
VSGPSATGILRLYVAGAADQSLRAIAAARACVQALGGGARLEVIDAYQALDRAHDEGVVLLPTAVWCDDDGSCRIVGDLSDPARLLAAISSTRGRSPATNRSPKTRDHAAERISRY